MKLPMPSPGKRGYDDVTMTTTCATSRPQPRPRPRSATRRPDSQTPLAHRIRAGSITGIRKRSCGKNTRHVATAAAASSHMPASRPRRGPSRHAPNERQRQEQANRQHAGDVVAPRVQRGTTDRPARRDRTPSSASTQPSRPDARESSRTTRGSRSAPSALRSDPDTWRASAWFAILRVRIGRHVAFAGRQRIVARPERDAAVGGDDHEPAVVLVVANRPRRQHQQQPEPERGERQATGASR